MKFENEIYFVVHGEPKSKLRPQFRRMGGFVSTYTPKKTKLAEDHIMVIASQHIPNTLITGPILLSVRAYRSPLKSFSKKKLAMALSGEMRPITKPDLDNYVKLVKDALNGLIWKDDAQVIEFLPGTGKYYGDPPRVEIRIRY